MNPNPFTVLEQPEGFLCAQLGNTGEILDTEAIQNLSACEFACARTQGTFDCFGH
jgi:hypothetical protein